MTGHADLQTSALEDLIGLPYQLGARLPGPATDCFGLVIEACRRRGVTIPDPFTSSSVPADARQWVHERLAGWVRCERPSAGAVVELRGLDVPAHVGYLLNDVEFLHSTKKTGVIISRLDREPWASRIVGLYAFCG